jgi:hypothetical protein
MSRHTTTHRCLSAVYGRLNVEPTKEVKHIDMITDMLIQKLPVRQDIPDLRAVFQLLAIIQYRLVLDQDSNRNCSEQLGVRAHGEESLCRVSSILPHCCWKIAHLPINRSSLFIHVPEAMHLTPPATAVWTRRRNDTNGDPLYIIFLPNTLSPLQCPP